MKVTIYRTDAHDHRAIFINGELKELNDHGIENLYRVLRHLNIDVEIITLSRGEFESRFC